MSNFLDVVIKAWWAKFKLSHIRTRLRINTSFALSDRSDEP
jgi:hypothetical protein